MQNRLFRKLEEGNVEGPTKVPIGGSSSCCRNDRQLMTPVRLPGIRELGSQRHLATLQNCVFFVVIVVDAVLVVGESLYFLSASPSCVRLEDRK